MRQILPGASAVICDSIAFYYLDAPVKRVCGLDVPIPYNRELERNAVPTVEKIEAAIKDIMEAIISGILKCIRC